MKRGDGTYRAQTLSDDVGVLAAAAEDNLEHYVVQGDCELFVCSSCVLCLIGDGVRIAALRVGGVYIEFGWRM
jgi:hypothetical protein